MGTALVLAELLFTGVLAGVARSTRLLAQWLDEQSNDQGPVRCTNVRYWRDLGAATGLGSAGG